MGQEPEQVLPEQRAAAAADLGWTLEIRFDFFPLEPWLDGVWYHLALVVWLLGFLSLGQDFVMIRK